jgi:hypothetical protein
LTAILDFAKPDVNNLRADTLDTQRAFNAAGAVADFSAYANKPVGTLLVSSAGGSTRVLYQWSGSAFTGFNLAGASFQADAFYFNASGAYISANSNDVALQGAVGSVLNYNRPGNVWDLYNNSSKTFTADAYGIGLGPVGASGYGGAVVSKGKAATSNASIALVTPQALQGEVPNIAFYGTFVGTGDNGARRIADFTAGFTTGAWGTGYAAVHVGNNGAANDARAVTVEQMRWHESGEIVQAGVTKDGVTGLQVKSIRATNQPFGVGIVSNGAANGALITFGSNIGGYNGFTANTANASITVNRAGQMRLDFYCQETGGSAGQYGVDTYINGAQQSITYCGWRDAAGGNRFAHGSLILRNVNAGDVFTFKAISTTGGSVALSRLDLTPVI